MRDWPKDAGFSEGYRPRGVLDCMATSTENRTVDKRSGMIGKQPSPQDIPTFRYANVSPRQLRSPIQFGQGTRPILGPGCIGLVTGFEAARLSDDILLEHARVLTANIHVSAGVGHGWIGRGQAAASSAPSSRGRSAAFSRWFASAVSWSRAGHGSIGNPFWPVCHS